MTTTAKLFITGGSQAVLLPRGFHFDGDEVFIRRDPATGDVVLSRKPENWQRFFEQAARTQVLSDFLEDRNDQPPIERE
jgi:antitoxin VapB